MLWNFFLNLINLSYQLVDPPVSSLHACLCMLSRVWLFVPPSTTAHQAPLSKGFPRQEYWSGLPRPPPGDLPNPRIEPTSLESPALAGRFFTTEPPRKPHFFLRSLWFSGWWGVFAAFHKCLCLNRALWNISLSSCSGCKYCPASSFPWCVLGSSMLPSWEYGAWNVDTYKCCWMNRLMSGCWVSRSFKSLNLAMLLTSFVSSDNSLSLSEPQFPNL